MLVLGLVGLLCLAAEAFPATLIVRLARSDRRYAWLFFAPAPWVLLAVLTAVGLHGMTAGVYSAPWVGLTILPLVIGQVGISSALIAWLRRPLGLMCLWIALQALPMLITTFVAGMVATGDSL